MQLRKNKHVLIDVKCQLLELSEVICLRGLAKVFRLYLFKSD